MSDGVAVEEKNRIVVPRKSSPSNRVDTSGVIDRKKGEFVRNADWGRTVAVVSRLENSPYYDPPDEEAPYGRFRNRPIIGRDTRINGGVYLGANSREGIVVDDNRSDQMLLSVFDLLQQRIKDAGTEGILDEVYGITQEYLPYSEQEVDAVNAKYNIKGDGKIDLATYMGHGGVCRHQALLAGYLIEKLIDTGVLRGKVSVDRNKIANIGAHAWVRFEEKRKLPWQKDKIHVIDPAQNYSGELGNVPKDAWQYSRPVPGE